MVRQIRREEKTIIRVIKGKAETFTVEKDVEIKKKEIISIGGIPNAGVME